MFAGTMYSSSSPLVQAILLIWTPAYEPSMLSPKVDFSLFQVMELLLLIHTLRCAVVTGAGSFSLSLRKNSPIKLKVSKGFGAQRFKGYLCRICFPTQSTLPQTITHYPTCRVSPLPPTDLSHRLSFFKVEAPIPGGGMGVGWVSGSTMNPPSCLGPGFFFDKTPYNLHPGT